MAFICLFSTVAVQHCKRVMKKKGVRSDAVCNSFTAGPFPVGQTSSLVTTAWNSQSETMVTPLLLAFEEFNSKYNPGFAEGKAKGLDILLKGCSGDRLLFTISIACGS